MSDIYEYKCGKCGYLAEVSIGRDSRIPVYPQTKVCPACRQLVHVLASVTRGMSAAEKKKSALTGSKASCCQCGGSKLSPWKARACPKCGGKMKKDLT